MVTCFAGVEVCIDVAAPRPAATVAAAAGGAVESPPAVVRNADNSAAFAGPSPSARLPVPRRSASVAAAAAQLATSPSPTRTCAHSRLHTSRSQYTSYVSSHDAGVVRGGESNELWSEGLGVSVAVGTQWEEWRRTAPESGESEVVIKW